MAIGGGLGALLAGAAGLGDAVEKARRDRIQQQDAEARRMLLQAQLQQYGPQNFQPLDTGGSDPFASMFGGGTAQPSPVGGAAALGPPMGGAPPSNYASGKGFGFADLRNLALQTGFPASKAGTAAAVGMAESSGRPDAYNPKDPGGSYGLMQINAKAHPDLPRTFDPTENMREAFSVSRGGQDFSPWSTFKSGAYRRFMPQGGAQPVNTARMGQPDTSPQARSEGAREVGLDGGAQPAQYSPDQAEGMPTIPQLNQALQMGQQQLRSNFVQRMQQARTPQERQFLQQDYARRGQELMTQYNSYKQQIISGQTTARQERMQTERMREQEKLTSQREAATSARQEQAEINKEKRQMKASQNIEVTNAEGKVTFSGAAHQTPQGWVSDKDNKPIETDGDIKILGRGAQGRQAAAQIQSMIGASSELVGEARNLMELPATATAGIFQGLQGLPADSLSGAVKRTLANKLTPEEATDLKTSFQGVSRSLATIEAQGRATGLVGLTGMSEQLMPQDGDTQGNILRKMATLRQIMERNIDAIASSPNATREQKDFLKQIRSEMESVIPFTVHDVNQLQHGDKESVAEAAKKFGLGQAPAGKAVAAPDEGGGAAGEVIQNGWRYDAKTHQPLGPVQQQ